MTEGLRVNFSDEEASSEARTLDPLPTGNYHVCLTDWDPRESKSEKNLGKPYWNLEFTVQDGPYEDRKVWTNCMLFDGALYTLAQLLKASGREDALKTGDVPDCDEFVGRDYTIVVKKQLDNYKMQQEGSEDKIYKNEIKGIKAYDGAVASGAPASGGSKDSLLP